jgi:hypothetical protein
MKRLLLIFLLLTSASFSQTTKLPVDSTTNLITYQDVVKVDGVSKDDIYVRAREWYARAFSSANSVIQMDDKAAGKIIGKGLSSSYYTVMRRPVNYNLHYTISITAKEGRYRYEITSFNVETGTSRIKGPLEGYNKMFTSGKGVGFNAATSIFNFTDATAQALTNSIKEALKQPAKGIRSKDDF